MELIKKNFGFGCMRLPMTDGKVDEPQFCKMIDRFIEEGFNYFDTAHGYIGGQSETVQGNADAYALEDTIMKMREFTLPAFLASDTHIQRIKLSLLIKLLLQGGEKGADARKRHFG